MPAPNTPLLIKRYASRRLYNTETSDYVTLEDIASFIRDGREVKIVDLKSGDELTRQYLLQIIAEHEGRGENVLPIDVLTDLVRSYATSAHSVVPQFLAASFEMLRESQSKLMENMAVMPNPIARVPGFDAIARHPGPRGPRTWQKSVVSLQNFSNVSQSSDLRLPPTQARPRARTVGRVVEGARLESV